MTFEEVFTIDNADRMALYIVNHFGEDQTKAIDYDFSLSSGVMSTSGGLGEGTPNLSFKFDTMAGSLPRQILEVLCDDDIDVTEERQKIFNNFLVNTGDFITNRYGNALRQQIRDVIFASTPTPEILPMASMKFIALCIEDIPEGEENVIVVKKDVPEKELDPTSEYSMESHSVSEELFNLHRETGKSFNEIVEEKKAAGDLSYKYISNVDVKKHFYECELNLFVDFSFINPS
jgi:tRNA threonylcarbamoyladenosine modification (KEOPS) complex Cgi121 subunit